MNRWLVIFCFFILPISYPLLAEGILSSTTAAVLSTQTVYYFDKDWKNIQKPVSGGFYRKILAIKQQGYLIQDFYQNSHNKQSDPIFLTVKADLIEGSPKSIEGPLILWYENGKKSMSVFYNKGKREGLLTGWYDNGRKEIEQNYLNDKENGHAIYWDEQGQRKLEFNFKEGNFNLISVWKDNRKVSETHYVNGKKEGISTYWYKNGTTKVIEHYHQNKLNGLYISFYPDGKKQSEFNYENNTPNQITFWYPNNRKAAALKRTQSKQFSCFIWDDQGTIVYQGENSERCILTVRNIFDGEITLSE